MKWYVTDLAAFMPAVAQALLGDPNERLSKRGRELRFGSNGSMSVDLEAGTYFDHEAKAGGGVLDLIKARKGIEGADAFAFLREIGCDVEDAPAKPNGARRNGNGHHHGEGEAERVFDETYSYTDENGVTLYQAIRCIFRLPDGSYLKNDAGKRKKTFLQRKPDPLGGWIWSVKGVRPVPYRLRELIEAIATDETVYLVEGERKADALRKLGLAATCNVGGSGRWLPELTPHFAGARVMILPDNDDAGRRHADALGAALADVAASVMVLDLPGLPAKGDIIDWIAEGGTREELLDLGAQARPWSPSMAPFVSRFNAVPWEKLDEPGPEHQFVIDGWFTVGDKAIIGGPSKSGKSFLAIHAAMAIARATPFFGAKVMAPGLVVYQAGEGARGIKKRLRAYRRHFGVPSSERVPFVLLQSKVDLYRADGDTGPLIEEIKAIAAMYQGSPLRAVFIDTLATATGGADENSGKDMSTVMSNIDRISSAFGCHVCLVHHLNAAGTKLRGHTSIFNNIDQAIFVTRDEVTKVRTAVLDKQKDEEDGAVLKFELASIEIGRRAEDDKPITSCVCVHVGERELLKKATAAQGFALKDKEDPIFRALMRAQREKPRLPDADMIALGVPSDAVAVHYRDWRDAYKIVGKEGGSDGEPPSDDTIRKRWDRDHGSLVKFDVIGWKRPWIWWTGKPIRGYPETLPVRAPESIWTETGQWADEDQNRTESGHAPDPDLF